MPAADVRGRPTARRCRRVARDRTGPRGRLHRAEVKVRCIEAAGKRLVAVPEAGRVGGVTDETFARGPCPRLRVRR